MNLLVVVSESHRVLYENWFLPGLPGDARRHTRWIDTKGKGDYSSEDWKSGVMAKLGFVREFCLGHPDEVFVLSDVDIQFFAGFGFDRLMQTLESSGRDILFQKERSDGACMEVNTGFFIARATPWVAALVGEALETGSRGGEQNDQILINSILARGPGRERWGHLPPVYYARSHGFPPPRGMLLHHANMTNSVAEKIGQLRRLRHWSGNSMAGKCRAVAGEMLVYLGKGAIAPMLRRKLRAFGNRDRGNSSTSG